MSKLRTILLAGAAVLALAFAATAFGDDVRPGRHESVELLVGNELGQQHEHELEHVVPDELGNELGPVEPDRRSRWGRLEHELDHGRSRRSSDKHGWLRRNGGASSPSPTSTSNAAATRLGDDEPRRSPEAASRRSQQRQRQRRVGRRLRCPVSGRSALGNGNGGNGGDGGNASSRRRRSAATTCRRATSRSSGSRPTRRSCRSPCPCRTHRPSTTRCRTPLSDLRGTTLPPGSRRPASRG